MRKILLSVAVACLGFAGNSFAQGLAQNFEGATIPSMPAGWTNTVVAGGGQGWVTNSGTYNLPLYPVTPHTKYALLDDAGHAKNNPSYMTSPTFDMTGMTTPYLAYDWFYVKAWLTSNNQHEIAWVELSTDGGGAYSFVDSIPGFSSTVTDWATQFVDLSSFTPTANCKLRFCYSDQGGGTTATAGIIGCAIDNILVYDAANVDLGIASVAPVAGSAAGYFMVGSGATFSGVVTNFGAAVSSYTVYYQVGAAAPVSQVISTPLTAHTASTAFTFAFTTPYTVAAATQYPVKIWAKATSDVNASNDTLGTSIIGVSFMPKKRLLYEEATGAWCGWCVRGIVYMDSLWRAHPNDVNIVSVHNDDSMMYNNTSAAKYDQMLGAYISGYPSMVIDRRENTDPSAAFAVYAAEATNFGFAEMGIVATTTGGNINAKVKVKPAMNMTGDYRIELVVTEDDVEKGSGSYGPGNMWKQHNYYAPGGPGNATPMQTIGYNFNTLGADISNIKYPFVARTTLPADLNATPNGIAGSLPSSMTSGTVYEYVATPITIQTGYTGWVASKLRVIALLIDNNSTSPTYGNVLNSISTKGLYLGVSDLKAGIENLSVYPNPATSEAHAGFVLSTTSTVSFAIYDVTGRQVFSAPSEEMSAGGHMINFSTSNLAAGVYNVVIRTENGQLTERLSVTK